MKLFKTHIIASLTAALCLLCICLPTTAYGQTTVDIPTAEDGMVNIPLSSLDLTNATCGWSTIKANKSIDGNAIKLKGTTYSSGVGTHSESTIVIQLNGSVKRFYTRVGIDDEVSIRYWYDANCDYLVYLQTEKGSTKTVAEGTITRNDTSTPEIDVDVSGWKYLILKITNGSDDTNSNDHVDWANAYLVQDASSTSPTIISEDDITSERWNIPNSYITGASFNATTYVNYRTLHRGVDELNTDIYGRNNYGDETHWQTWRSEMASNSIDDSYDEDFTYTTVSANISATGKAFNIQATHTYVDTLYVRKGEEILLTLPNVLQEGSTRLEAARYYFRWYNYATDNTWNIDYTEPDTLPDGTLSEVEYNFDIIRPVNTTDKEHLYKTSDGYVSGGMFSTSGNQNLTRVYFYYPTDEEFNSWYNYADADGITNKLRLPKMTNREYYIACDVSAYQENGINSTDLTITEPSLSQRLIFYISGIDDDVTDTDFSTDESAGKQGYDQLPYWSTIHAQCVEHANTQKEDYGYYENYTVTFPYRRMAADLGGHTKVLNDITATVEQNIHREYQGCDMVALNKDARYIYVPGGDWGEGVTVTLEDNTAGITFPVGSYNSDPNSYTVYGGGEDYSGNLYRAIPFLYPNTVTEEGSNKGTQTVNAPNSHVYLNVKRKGIDMNGNEMNYHLARILVNFIPEGRLLTRSEIIDIDSMVASEELMRFATLTPNYLKSHDNYVEVASLSFDYDDNSGNNVQQNNYYKYPMNWSHSSYGFYDGSSIASSGGNTVLWGQYGIVSRAVDDSSYGAIRATDNKFFYFVDASDRPGHIATIPVTGTVCAGAEVTISAWIKNAKGRYDRDDAGIMFSVIGEKKTDGTTTTTVLHRFQSGQIPATRYIERYGYTGNEADPETGLGTDEWVHFAARYINDDANYDSYYLRLDNRSFSTTGADYYVDEVRLYVNTISATARQIAPTCESTGTKVQLLLDYDRVMARTGMTENTSEATESNELAFAIVNVDDYEKWLAEGHATTDTIDDALYEYIYLYDADNDNKLASEKKNMEFLTYTNYFDGLTQYDSSTMDANTGNSPTKIGANNYWRAYTDTDGTRYLSIDINANLQGGTRYYLVLSDAFERGNENNKPYFSARDACDMYSEFTTLSTTVLKINGDIVQTGNEYCVGQINTFSATLSAYTSGETREFADCYFDWYIGDLTSFTDTERELTDNTKSTLYSALSVYRLWYPTGSDLSNATPQASTTDGQTALTQAQIDLLREAVENGTLYLYRRILTYRMTESTNIVAAPVPFEEDGYLFCWDPVALALTATTSAPVVYVGYQGVEGYPENYDPALRIGLNQLKSATSETNYIEIPLRNILSSEGNATTLDLVLEEDKQRDEVFLIASDDPKEAMTGGQYDVEVGKVKSLYAKTGDEASNLAFYLYADSLSKFREGFTYSLMVNCKEQSSTSTNTCYATILVPVKIVPEYLRWTGGADDNWNNDEHWRRSTAAELNKTATDYDYADAPSTNFVPMSFSKVTVPASAQVRLYYPGKKTGILKELLDLTTTEISGSATTHIEYDLMATGNDGSSHLSTVPYYSNTVAQIHFEPQSEMLHTEYLTYDKAWVDYKLNVGQWYTLASPLQNVYAGDFYAPTATGQQNTEYFQDITFDTQTYSRFAPAIYQRSWDKGEALRYSSANSSENLVMEGVWSSVYNDVNVNYTPATGFSLKAAKGQMSTTSDNVLIRLPKADASYSYFDNSGTQGHSAALTRTDSVGKLRFAGEAFSVELKQNGANAYYLVGNPYMTHLDMKAFFDANDGLLERKFWTVTENNQSVMINPTDNDWITAGSTEATQVGPLQAFFVTKKADATGTTVTFNKSMQALGTSAATTSAANMLTRSSAASAITLTVVDDGKTAVIVPSESASADFVADEDAEILLDGNLDQATPYSVAGTYAAAINSTCSTRMIPVGLFGESGELVKVRLSGLPTETEMKLYDTTTGTTTALAEGDVVEMMGEAHGRYYLLSGNMSATASGITIYSTGNGELVVASLASPLKNTYIYSPDGRTSTDPTLSVGKYSTKYKLSPGIYVVKALNEDGEQVSEKLMVP